ncbi:uncharacterized protein LOC133904339 [Phragmites australis]|uniref:uncharacterized protein LOC133904339 n=1 Tax=Phragmites australis TaxID=29695 RepID=UPI002D7718B2|nr:uncharacterized protein LOC133904339 [Phragmites australis]
MASSPFFSGSVSVILLFALLFTGTHTMVTANVPSILPVCKTVSGLVDPEFCLEALGSDGRSVSAGMDYRTYSIIAVDLLTANATSTATKIDGLLREGGSRDDDATTRCLRSCQALYSGIVQTQPSVQAAINDKRDGEAASSLETSASAAMECEDGFGKNNVASPVTAEDKNAFQLAKLAIALLTKTATHNE